MKIDAIDLFCGAGGLTHGLELSGVNVIAGYDIDESCRYPYEINNNATFINKNITLITAAELNQHFNNSEIRLLAGCAPCQPFSNYTQSLPKDDRWNLLYEFARLVAEVRPELITMENVPELENHKVFTDFVFSLKKIGYHIWYSVVFCPEYGLPQRRNRLVLMASLLGKISLIPPTHIEKKVGLREAIGSLPKLTAGTSNKHDPLHRAAGLSETNLKRILASRPNGTWKDWPKELLAKCHKRNSGAKYTSVYGRMSWNELSPTITTQFYNYGSGRYGHPTQARAISLREAAILQSFPAHYKFVPDNDKYSIGNVARMIGNAVPVCLGVAIGKSFSLHVTP
ncbi:MAG: DNA cytosine methyltransferase [Moraxellaceae bacterium]|nr:MAG: DNA cytosine methyltransferase [Moraxellaceae bacterium]